MTGTSNKNSQWLSEHRLQIAALIFLILLLTLVSGYLHLALNYDRVFTLLFCIPIVLAGFWFGRLTVLVSAGLGASLLIPHRLAMMEAPIADDLIRAFIYLLIGIVAGEVGEFAKRSQRSLREANDYLENVFSKTGTPIVIWGADMKIVRFNKAAEDLTGWSTNEMIGQNVVKLFPPEMRERLKSFIGFASIMVESDEIELTIRRKDGTDRTVLWSFGTLHGEDGVTSISTIAQGQDITERKLAEDAALASSKKYHAVFDSAASLILLIDQHGVIIDCSASVKDCLGYEREELVNRSMTILLHSDFHQTISDSMEHIVSNGSLYGREYRFVRKDGRIIDVSSNSSAIFDSNGCLQNIVCIIDDITDRKRSANDLRRTKEFYEQILDSMMGGVWAMDAMDQVIYANYGLERISGLPKDHLVGARIDEFPEETLVQFMSFYDEAKKCLDAIRYEGIRVVTPVGRESYQSGWLIPMFTNGEYGGMICTVEDVTAAVTMSHKLERSEAMFRSLAEQMPNMVFIINRQRKFIYVNPSGLNRLGYEWDELTRPDFDIFSIIEKQYRTKALDRTQLIFQGQELASTDYRMVTKNDEIIDVLSSSHMIDHDGEPAMLTILTDISLIRQVECKLKESEEQFRMLCEESPNMIFINQDGRITYANNRCAEKMGYSLDELYASDFDFRSLIHASDQAKIADSLAEHAKGLEVSPLEYRVVKKNGECLDAILGTRLITFRSRPAIIGMVTDITERRLAEQALAESEKRYRDLVELSPDLIAVFEDKDLVFINGAGAEMLGAAEVPKCPDRRKDFCVDQNSVEKLKTAAELLVGPNTTPANSLEISIQHENNCIHLAISAILLGDSTEDRFLIVGRDVTAMVETRQELAQAQQQLIESEKMAAMGAISCGVAHELSNPLMGVIGYLYELKKRAAHSIDEEIADRAMHETERCVRTINELLLLGRPVPEDLAAIDPNELMNHGRSFHHELLDRQGIEYKFESDSENIAFLGIRTHIDLLLDNLIKNAVDAMEDSSIKKLRVKTHADENGITIEVSDTGVGIASDQISRICEPFYTTKGPQKGTGLGMAICQTLVKNWNGSMAIDSRPGKGTTVTIFMPLEIRLLDQVKVNHGH